MSDANITADVLQQQVEDQIASVAMNDIKLAMDSFYTALVVKPQEEVAQLPEDVFRAVFWPFFSGQLSLEESDSVVANWISIAGSPYSEVDILDPQRKVLFRVPALFDSTVVDPNEHRPGDSLADIYAQSKMRARNIPAAGQRYLNEALTEKNKALTQDSQQLSKNQQAWLTIFQYYGLAKTTLTSPVEKVDISEDLDYD